MNDFINLIKTFNSKQQKLLFLIFLTGFLIAILELIGIGLFYPLLDVIINENDKKYELLVFFFKNYFGLENIKYILIILLIFVFAFKNIILFSLIYVVEKFILDLTTNLSSRIYQNYIYEEYNFHILKNSSELVRNISSELKITLRSFLLPIINLSQELIIVIFIFFGIFIFNYKIAIILIVSSIIIFILIFFPSRNFIKLLSKKRQNLAFRILKHLHESFEGIAQIKINNQEEYFVRDFFNKQKKTNRIQLILKLLGSAIRPITETLAVTSFSILLMFLIYKNQEIKFYLPTLGFYFICVLRVVPSLNKIITLSQSIKFAGISVNKILPSLTFFKGKIKAKKIVNPENKIKHKISLKNISFSYGENLILKNINCEIYKKQITGIYGKSGSGKSTLLNIIFGFLKPTSGKIFFDETEISELNISKTFAYCVQSPYIFDENFDYNITLEKSKDNIDKNKLLKSYEFSNIDFRNNFTDLDMLGELGSKISKGQAQRIGLARNYYLDREIMIFDEATSNLDDENRNIILRNIEDIKNYKTIIIVSHNKDDLKICDQIIDLNAKGN